jgi:signal peptidase I
MSEERAEQPEKESWGDFIRFAFLAALIVLPIRFFIAQPFVVSGASMVPTFGSGDYLIIDELSYRFEPPRRGDVVVFRFPLEPKKFLIKRVAGLPGETIEIKGDSVTIRNRLHPEGFVWKQGELASSGRRAEQTVTLRDSEYFVLGDNRDQSADSRLWGPLSQEFIVGRPLIRLFPIGDIGLFPGAWESTLTE